jgi:hypothetical protein
VGKEEKPVWCPVVYEFLPDFCYTCGLIGHIDKTCSQNLKEGEVQQYSKKLRYIPEKRRSEDGGWDRSGGGRFTPSWRSGSGGSRSQQWGMGSRMSSGRLGSDGPSWRKEDDTKNKEKKVVNSPDGKEVTSPIKKSVATHQHTIPGQSLLLEEGQKENNVHVSAGSFPSRRWWH